MDTSTDNIYMNSCQYTPVYFIDSPAATQSKSFVISQNNPSPQKPVSDNLKRFYESSGKLETNLNHAENSCKPRILKKQECNVVGNNLKLASFLLPKSEAKVTTKASIVTPVNNMILKPMYVASNPGPAAMSKLDINSKIVKLKDLPNITRSQNGRILPKIKPKEKCHKSRHTSVQLLKLGETYHSLNRLSNDQMKIVNHALQIFNNPQNTPPEPTYDPVTNTKYIYKVVSPKDLAVVGKNKELLIEKKTEIKKEISTNIETEIDTEIDHSLHLETKVTRSGRIVKLPKNILTEETPSRTKKKNGTTVSCLQCSSKFCSPQRLNRHYEYHPSHLPSRLHNDLFQCLVTIVQASSEENQASTFIEQLENLIEKIKCVIPCLMKTDGTSTMKTNKINEDIGRLFGINPGDYKLNIDALYCKKNQDGYCSHNPAPPPPKIKTPPHVNIEEIIKTTLQPMDVKRGDRIKTDISTEKRQTVIKIENRKQKLEQKNHNVGGKKVKLATDSDMSLTIDDIVSLITDTNKTDSNVASKSVENVLSNNDQTQNETLGLVNTKPAHIQFHSTHFDIRSSPIKSSSTVFRKFQINPEKMAKYEVQIVQPLQLNQLAQEMDQNLNTINAEAQSIFGDNPEQLEDTTKDWPDNANNFIRTNSLISDQSDDFMRSDALIEPALIHIKDTKDTNRLADNSQVDISDDFASNNGHALISFLESLGNELTGPDTAVRNNSIDFQMDLFSFNNS